MASISTDGGEGTISKRPRRHSPSSSPSADPTPPPPQLKMEDEEEEEEEEEEQEEEEDEDNEEEEEEEEEDEDNEEEEEEEESESEREVSVPPPPVARKFALVRFNDTEILDCSICTEPLSIPVFQCDNGHIACSSCCNKLAKKCASCTLPIGYVRCRAIEKVLDSVLVSCRNMEYGCQEEITYSKKREHEKDCGYVPILCPVTGCNFIGSCKQLHQHFGTAHSTSVINFHYSRAFTIPIFFRDTKVGIVLRESYGASFILHHKVTIYGSAIIIGCLNPLPSKAKHLYCLEVSTGHGSSIKFQSYTKKTDSCFYWPTSAELLIIPENFFYGTPEQLNLSVSIA